MVNLPPAIINDVMPRISLQGVQEKVLSKIKYDGLKFSTRSRGTVEKYLISRRHFENFPIVQMFSFLDIFVVIPLTLIHCNILLSANTLAGTYATYTFQKYLKELDEGIKWLYI